MSDLATYAIPMRGGLDLNSPRFSVTPGTLSDCLNFETFGVAGYSVSEGFHRYDGTYPCFVREWIIATDYNNPELGTFQQGELLSVNGNVFGVCVYYQADPRRLHFLVTNQVYAPHIRDTIHGETSGANQVPLTGGIKKASQYYADQAAFLAARDLIYTTSRELKESIYPFISYAKNDIPHGLHWYKDRLYAIINHYKITFENGKNEAFPGDVIKLFDESKSAIIIDIKLTEGSWAAGTAEGEILVRPASGGSNTFDAAGEMLIIRPNTTPSPILGDLLDWQVGGGWGAGIYKSVEDGDIVDTNIIGVELGDKRWAPIDMGWEIDFTTDQTCTAEGIPTLQRWASEEQAETLYGAVTSLTAVATSETLGTGFTTTNPLGAGSVTDPSSTALSTVLNGNDSTFVSFSNVDNISGTTGWSAINGFDLSAIPDAAIITGFTITVKIQTSILTSTPGSVTVKLDGARLIAAIPSPSPKTQFWGEVGATSFVLGSSTDMWGVDSLDSPTLLDMVKNDPSFGIKFNLFDPDDAVPPTAVFRLVSMNIQVYYRPPVDKVYAYDPITDSDIKIDIPYYILRKGLFAPADASDNGQGTAVVYNLEPLDAGTGSSNAVSNCIKNGWELRTAIGGGGTKIANITSNMRSQMLPSRSDMAKVNKRFEIITANFFSQENYEAFYGVDGVGPAFQYDGTYFFKTFTKLPIKEDHPSHVAFFKHYLCLGFDSGQMIVSSPGEPTNFDPVLGSTLYSTGDRITGLLALKGAALAICCENSIHALKGNNLSSFDNDVVMEIISPYSGAIEYTVVDCGVPMFVDYRGISTIEVTDTYGDFANGRISYKITPYLDERVNDRFGYQSARQNVLFAQAVKSKNQYRVVMADGDILTCTLPTADRDYEFTRQKYTSPFNHDHMIPIAMCSGTGNKGTDMLFGTFLVEPDDNTNLITPSNAEREVYVYMLDRGTRFDLAPIDHFLHVNFMSIDDPTDFQTLKAIQLEILGYNYLNETISVAKDYQPFNAVKKGINIEPTGQRVLVQREPAYLNVGAMDSMGKTLAIELRGRHIYPGYVVQAMAMWYIPQRTQLGASPTQSITKGN